MILLILAIIAVHGILLWLVVATGSNEQKIYDTRKQIEEGNALISEMENNVPQVEQATPSSAVQKPETGASSEKPSTNAQTQQKPASAAQSPTAVQTQTGNSAGKDPLAELPAVKDKPAPSVPSTTYVRKPRKTVVPKLDFAGAARDDISGLKGITLSTAGILVDMDTNKVLWAKNPSKPVPVASLTKIMTIMLAYEIAMDDSSPYTLQSMIPVTPEAINTEASKVYFKNGEMFTIDELLIAASVRSANDAAHLLAEHLGGGKADKFIEDMNRRAKEVGMTHTTYFNAHGLPGKTKALDNQSSCEDVARLCLVFRNYPYLMELAGKRTAPFREKESPDYILLQNHNNLLPGAKTAAPGVNGIKTGFTNRAGFCVAASCEREGRNLLAVVTGFPSAADRDNFIRALLDWGYAKIGVAKAKTSTSTKSTSTKSTSTKSSSTKSSTSSKTTSTKKGR
ncbi:MAG: serine hydrolase [Lentisphaeria bacterium]|nr:serine hydrolase [Lentisphaeria bacterium]MBR3687522.1 serine hydrolase [Lentisphaeria bacterium]